MADIFDPYAEVEETEVQTDILNPYAETKEVDIFSPYPELSADTLDPPDADGGVSSTNKTVVPPIDPTEAYSVPFAGMGNFNPYESEYQAIQDAKLAEEEKQKLAIQAERDALKNEIVLEQMQQPPKPQVEVPIEGSDFAGGPQDFSTAFKYGDFKTRGNIQNLLADTEESLSGTGLARTLQNVQNKSLPFINSVRSLVGAEPLPEDANLRASILKELELERSADAYLKAAEELGFKPMRVGEIENFADFLTWAKTTAGASGSPMLVSMATGGALSPLVLGSELDANLREIEGLSKGDRLKLAYTGGMIAGLLENLGLAVLVKGMPDALVGKIGLNKIAKEAEKYYGTRVAKGIVEAAAAEGITELAQEGTFIGIEAGAGKEFKEGEIAERLTEAGAGGSTLGSAFGGARSVVTEKDDAVTKAAKEVIRNIDNADRVFTNTTEVARNMLSVNPEIDRDQRLLMLAERAEATGFKEAVSFARGVRRNIGNERQLTPESFTFYEEKVAEYENKAAGQANKKIVRADDAFESLVIGDIEGRNQTYLDALQDPITREVLVGLRQQVNAVADALYDAGYNYSDAFRSRAANDPIRNAGDFMAKAGAATRLINQYNAYKKGYKGSKAVDLEKLQKQIDAVRSEIDQDLLNSVLEGIRNNKPDERVFNTNVSPANPNLLTVKDVPPNNLTDTTQTVDQPETQVKVDEPSASFSETEPVTTTTSEPDPNVVQNEPATLPEPTNETTVEPPAASEPVEVTTEPPEQPVVNEQKDKQYNPQQTTKEVGVETDGEVKKLQTPDGQKEYNIKGKVVELADLKQAYGVLQPRDRTRKDSETLARERAGTMFNPDRLLDDPTTGSGGPIIAKDGMILSGNGRVLTMRMVYKDQGESLAKYRTALENAGIDTKGFKQPVFVRQLTDDMTLEQLQEFADLSNTEAQAQMSMTERAKRDATRLTESEIIDLYRSDFEINSVQNRLFVNEYAKKILSPTEKGAFVKSDGSISSEGISRVRNAILASAFDDPDTLSIMLESPDDNIKAIGNAFMATAPKFAQLKKQINDGRTDAAFDITPKLAEMANLISRLRSEGVKPKDYYNQDTMFETPDPEVKELVRSFYNSELTKPNSMKAMKEFMDFYVDEALKKETGGLLEDTTTAQDIIQAGRQKIEDKKNDGKQQQGLFEAESNVESINESSKQVQKPRNAKRSQKLEKDERKADFEEVGTAFDANDVTTVSQGYVFENVSQTLRQSIYRDAFADSGLSIDAIENKSTEQKFAILARTINKKFGLSGVKAPDEGAGYTQVNQLLDAYHNLQWMTHALAMPSKFIGLDGKISLELPDKATRFLGAFYGGSNVIVMPQRSNSFAHEFGHALDYYLMDRFGNLEQAGNNTRGLSGLVRATQKSGESPWLSGAPKNVETAFGNVINALFLDNADLSLKIMALEQSIAKAEARAAKTGKPSKKLEKQKEQLRKLLEGSGRSKVTPSEFKKTSAKFGKRENKQDYYLRPTEMFARAFEAYIAQTVEAAGGRNEFITKGDDAYQLAAEQVKGYDIRLAETFPKDHERHNIFLAMDQLIESLRSESIAQGSISDAPGDADMIDARAGFWGSVQYEERGSLADAPKRVVKKIIDDQKRASQAASNRAKALAVRPSQFTGDTKWQRKWNEFQDTYGGNFINTKRQILFNHSDRYKPTLDKDGNLVKGNEKVRNIMEEIISKVATDPGTRQERVTGKGGTFEEATRIEARRFYATYDKIANEFEMDLLTDAEQKELRLLLTGEDAATSKASPKMLKLAGRLRRELLNPIYDYMVKNGQDINYVQGVGYMPRMLDAPLAIQEISKFLGELNGDKGAIPLYQQVIFDNEYGGYAEGDIDQIKSLVNLALSDPKKTDIGALIQTDYAELADIAAEMKQIIKNIDQLNSELDNDTGDVEVGDVEGAILELTESLSEMHEQLHAELRDPYAIVAGRDWHTRIAVREGADPSTNGVQGSFAKKRKLPPETDKYMNDFYLNPTDAIMQYIPSAVRATEYNTRFGRDLVPKGSKMKDGRQIDYLEYLIDEAKMAGMKAHEAAEVKTIVQQVTGRYPGPDHLLARTLNGINTYGTMALLPRAVISSVAEPLTAAIQTGSVVDGFKNFAYALDGLGASLRGKSAVERKMYYAQLANVLGVIDLPQTGEVMNNRLGGTSAEDSRNAARLATFFLRTGLTNITIAQRKASMRTGLQFLIEQAAQYRNQDVRAELREEARQTLQDFGVRPEDMEAFTEFAENLDKTENGLYEIDQIMDIDGSLTDMGRILATATNRFVDQTIQDPKIVDRPKWAETPMGRIVFGIQSFIAAFQRNVLEMSVKRAARDFKTQGAVRGTGKLIGKTLLPLFSLYAGHTLVSAAREFIFNRDKWEEQAEEEDRNIPIKYLMTLGISRSGFTGRFDPIANAFMSLKYQADLSNVLVGATGSYILKAVQRIANLGVGNSPNTVSREYQAARGVYDLLVPLVAGRLAVMPGVSHLVGYGLGGLDMALTSPTTKHYILRNFIKLVYNEEYEYGGGGRRKKDNSRFAW